MFYYELHQHTKPVSACAGSSPAETARGVKADGFHGVVLTNHFYHGNTGVQRSLPWADFVRAYEEDYLAAKAEGEKIGVDVLFGIEEGVGDGKEVLIYGITPAVIAAHPEWRDGDLNTIAAIVHEAGGLVIHAHPFRTRSYINRPWEPIPAACLDGYEVANACSEDIANQRTALTFEGTGAILTAGSDAHSANFPYSRRFGIAVEERITDEAQLAAVLRGGNYRILREK